MKRLRLLTFGVAALLAAAIMFNSCKKEDPVTPTLQFIAEVDGYDVTLTAEATGATSWAWDYGDGNTSTTAGSHSYSYEAAGSDTYTITCTVTSKDNLTAMKTASATIAASLEEIIAGTGTEGKTWVLTQTETSYIGKMGGGGIHDTLGIYPDFALVADQMLAGFGLGEEYTDEFTFYRNGTLSIDLKNDRSLVGIVYGNIINQVTQAGIIESTSPGTLPLASIPGTNMADATWSLSYADRTVQWYDEFETVALAQTTFTFKEDDPDKIAELVLSAGAYVCINDLYFSEAIGNAIGLGGEVDNSIYILKEVTGDMMNIAVAINSWPEYGHLPSLFLHMVLEPK